jgi:hypothetical protein
LLSELLLIGGNLLTKVFRLIGHNRRRGGWCLTSRGGFLRGRSYVNIGVFRFVLGSGGIDQSLEVCIVLGAAVGSLGREVLP